MFGSYHLEIDGQSEIVNHEIEKHLQNFIHYQQDDWVDKLPIAKFAANNNKSISTKLTSFFVLKGLHLHISFDIIDFSESTTCKRINKKKDINISEAL